jgi:hypothetical protein
MSNPWRVGIAGYGLAGRYFHAPLLKGCGYEVAGGPHTGFSPRGARGRR